MIEENHKVTRATENEQSQQPGISTDAIKVTPKLEKETDTPDVFDETWAELTQDWQTQPTAKADISALVKRTRRRTYVAKICFILNIVATLGIFIAFVYGIYDGQWAEPVNIYLGLGSLLSAIFLYFETKIRLATWSQLCDSPEKAIDNAIASCQSSMKYLQITKISFLPFLPLVHWFVYTVSQTSAKASLPAYLFANGFMLAMYLIVNYLYQRRRKEYQQLIKASSA